MNEPVKEYYTLRSGEKVPKIGFGCYNPKKQDYVKIVRDAIEAGYRYFDTASLYKTERDVAKAIRETGISRSELQIASKAWYDETGYDEVRAAFSRSLERLETDYIDVFMIHWPKKSAEDEEWKERNKATWKALLELKQEGKIRHLGTSNFLPHHIMNLCEDEGLYPEIDQLEEHIGYTQEAARAYLNNKKILVQGWAPLGRGNFAANEVIMKIADKYAKAYGKSTAQFCLRFLVQKGIMPVAKASTKDHMIANADIFDFEISEEDMWILTCMQQENWQKEHPDFCVPAVSSDRSY